MLALLIALAGVTGFEPAKTGFGDQRPSHRVLTPVAVATGVEPLPPDRQSGILPLNSATTLILQASPSGFRLPAPGPKKPRLTPPKQLHLAARRPIQRL